MHQSLSVGDVMRREYVGVSEGDSVRGVAKLMHQEGVDGAIVLRGPNPVGVFTASDVATVVAEGMDPETATVGEAMRQPAISVDAEDDLREAAKAMADRDVRRLAVVSNGGLVGTVREHDVLTAPGMLTPVGSSESADPPTRGPPPGAEPSPEDTTYTTQGICEICGALSRALDPHNGQLVCEECRAM